MDTVGTPAITTKHPGGRPSKYDPSFVDEVYKYPEECDKAEHKFRRLPKRTDIALRLNVDEDTLNAWASVRYPDDHPDKALRGELKHPEFLGALKRVDMAQKGRLMEDGFYGGKYVNARLAEFLLEVNHGLIKTERRIFGGDAQLDPVQIIITEEDKSKATPGVVVTSSETPVKSPVEAVDAYKPSGQSTTPGVDTGDGLPPTPDEDLLGHGRNIKAPTPRPVGADELQFVVVEDTSPAD